MSRIGIVVGGAKCVWDDVKSVRELFTPDVNIIVNDIGVVWPHGIDIWVSYHSDMLVKWSRDRRNNGLPDAGKLFVGPVCGSNEEGLVEKFQHRGGSSGLLAVMIALNQGVEKLVLCGIPMDTNMPHFNNKHHGKPWKDGHYYIKHWNEQLPLIKDKVRSMSGNTKEWLGLPTPEWLSI